MTADLLRKKYLTFFEKKGHTIIPSASLIPENDPTVLFTTAGMHPLIPYLVKQPHPEGKRLTNFQKCIRTGDIEKVGNPTHHTFFEMLGNWSLGDYFKKDAIAMSFEFLTKELTIPPERLAVSVFQGDKDAPKDIESAHYWMELGIPKSRIAYLPKSENWWGPAGETGPCGPDTEMFFWVDKKHSPPKKFDPLDVSWVEIWNNVFLQYHKNKDGAFQTLTQKNVDTGMGVERTLACLKGLDDNYLTELFTPLIEVIQKISNKKYGTDEEVTRSMRIIADHMRAATFILGDEKGIVPSNLDQGYILRRLIRRAIRFGRQIGIQHFFTEIIARTVIENYDHVYPELLGNKDFILNHLKKEETQFTHTLQKGLKEFEKISAQRKTISGKDAFLLFSTYGFPLEMTLELAAGKEIKVDKDGFDKEFQKHQELSRTASAGRFKGGLADASEKTIRLHTATHLLLAALRKVLGNHVYQKGSNITQERLRLDFSHPQKMTEQEINLVEHMVNKHIQNDLLVHNEIMPLKRAKKLNAMGVFEHKYDENVSVYTIGDLEGPFSREICGGPHVKHTSEIGHFKIKKEQSIAAGIRRIKAVIE